MPKMHYFKFKTSQNSKNVRLNGHTSFESQTTIITLRVSCFGHICNHPHGQENHTQKYINMVVTVDLYALA